MVRTDTQMIGDAFWKEVAYLKQLKRPSTWRRMFWPELSLKVKHVKDHIQAVVASQGCKHGSSRCYVGSSMHRKWLDPNGKAEKQNEGV